MVAAAIIGAGVLTAGAGVYSSNRASGQQQNAANQASATQLQMQQNAINQVAPWRNAGMGALQQYSMLMGLGPVDMGGATGMQGPPPQAIQPVPPNVGGSYPTGTSPAGTSPGAPNQWVTGQGAGGARTAGDASIPINPVVGAPTQTSGPSAGDMGGGGANPAQNIQQWLTQLPGYQFQLGQGMNAVENSAAARGMGLSSNTLQNLDQFGQGLAGTTFNQWLDRLNNMSTLGANASTGNATNIMQSASNIGGYQIGAGNAAAAGTIGSANAIAGGVNNSMNNYLNYSMMQGLLGGGGGGGGGGTGDVVPTGSLGSGMFDLFGGGGGP